MTKIWNDGRTRRPLPIDTELESIINELKDSQVVIVQADTGAGKTIRIAQEALLDHDFLTEDGQILMSQTRRAAVLWNGRRISSEMGEEPGERVGWRLRNETPVVSDQTKLTLLVDQSLANKIRRENRLPKGLLIIDEAHERNISTDLLLMMIKELLPQSPETKVLITSATIDTKQFSEYFEGAPVIKIKGRCFPVSEEVEVLKHAEHHSSGAYSAAEKVIDRFLSGELKVPAINGEGEKSVEQGTVIVLLPGKEDIRNGVSYLNGAITRRDGGGGEVAKKIQILSCHGESTPQDLDLVQSKIPGGTLRIVLATEILRSSVTVESTVGVIDSLQIKRLFVDDKNVAHLGKIPVSRAEADQAKGRAGRTGPGFYIPISFNNEYHNLLPYPQPAILREPIAHVVLQIADMGRSIKTAELIDKPSEEKIESAIEHLKLLGCLDDEENITHEGKTIVRLPVDPERARMLITATKMGVLPETIIITSALEEEGFFYFPREEDKKEIALKQRKGWAGDQGDFFAIVNAFRAYKLAESDAHKTLKEKREAGLDGGAGLNSLMREWCLENNINFKKIKLVESRVSMLCEEIRSISDQLERDTKNSTELHLKGISTFRDFDIEKLLKTVLSGLIHDVSVMREGGYRSRYRSMRGEFGISYSSTCPASKLILTGGKLTKVTLGRSSDYILLSDVASPIKPEWLEEVFPHLCERVPLRDFTYVPEEDVVKESIKLIFNGIDVAKYYSRSEDNEGSSRCFAKWLAVNGEKIDDESASAVFSQNMQKRKKAIDLNIRNGSKIFNEYPSDILADFYFDRLAGARSVGEIGDFTLISIPEPDQETKELMELVESENPDSMELLGKVREVRYIRNYPPSIEIPREEERDLFFYLSGSTVQLPGGKEVALSLNTRPSTISSSNVEELKNAIRISQNYDQWEGWLDSRNKPSLDEFNQNDIQSQLPPVKEHQYGVCCLTNSPLVVYGAYNIRLNKSYYGDSCSVEVNPYWTYKKTEIDSIYETSKRNLTAYRDYIAKEARLELANNLKIKASDLFNRIRNLTWGRDLFDLTDGRQKEIETVREGLTKIIYNPQEEDAEIIAEAIELVEKLPMWLEEADEVKSRREEDWRITNDILEKHYAVCPICGREWRGDKRECFCPAMKGIRIGLVMASYPKDNPDKIIVSARVYKEKGQYKYDPDNMVLRVGIEDNTDLSECGEIITEYKIKIPREKEGEIPPERKREPSEEEPQNPVELSGDLDRPATEEDLSALLNKFNGQ